MRGSYSVSLSEMWFTLTPNDSTCYSRNSICIKLVVELDAHGLVF